MSTRAAVFAGAGLVGVATAAVSTVSLYRLAVDCSFDWWLAPALPIALDAGATVGALAWITEKNAPQTWGRTIAVAALAESLAGNGIQHAIEAGKMRPTLALVLAVGATIPAMLWAVVHLAALMSTKPSGRMKSSKPRGMSARTAPTTSAPAAPAPSARERGDRDERVAWLAAREPETYTKEIAAVCERFGVSESTAKRIQRAARRSA